MSFALRLLPVLALVALAARGEASAATAAPPAPAAAAPTATAAAPAANALPQPEDNASQYCRNIANPAADARYARQVDALTALEKEIDDRLAKLEAKRAEYEDWVKQRQDMMSKADESVVAIYSQMRPDAASLQIAAMDEAAAAAILAKLSPRIASAILNEMDAATAAHLTNVMAGLPSATKVNKT